MFEVSADIHPNINFKDFRIARVSRPKYVARRAKLPEKPEPTRQVGEFLKGPVPLDWLSTAAKLPGKVLQTALAIWFEYGRRREAERFPLTSAVLNRFGVSRKAKYSALDALEKAGLISVVHRNKRNPLITVLQ